MLFSIICDKIIQKNKLLCFYEVFYECKKIATILLLICILTVTIVYYGAECRDIYEEIKNESETRTIAFGLFFPILFACLTCFGEFAIFLDIWYFLFNKEKQSWVFILHIVSAICSFFILSVMLLNIIDEHIIMNGSFSTIDTCLYMFVIVVLIKIVCAIRILCQLIGSIYRHFAMIAQVGI